MFLVLRIIISSRRQIHSKNATILKAAANHKGEVLRLLKDVFFKTDPSSVYSKVAEKPISPLLQKLSIESFHDDVTYIAKVENDKIVGVALNAIRPTVPKRHYMEDYINKIESKNEKILLELWKFISTMPPNQDKYFTAGEQLLDICFMVVDPEFRNLGIGKSLIDRSLKEADDKGLKFVRVDCTSHFTARIASAAGMDRIYELNYTDYRDSNGEQVFKNVEPPHIQIVVYARKRS